MKPDDMPFMSTSSLYTDSNYMHCSINGEDKKKDLLRYTGVQYYMFDCI